MESEGRMERGWRLTRMAWGVLIRDRTALVLAFAQGLSNAVIVVALFVLSGWAQHPGQGSRILLAALIAYWPSTLVSTFIGVALCAAAAAAMDGGHLTLRQALGVPARRPGQILLWSLLSAGVGLLIEQLASRIPFGGRLLTWLAGVAWSLGTLLVLPILALDGCTAADCVRRSSKLIKQRWGEGLTGNLAIGAWSVIVAVPLVTVVAAIDASTRSRVAVWSAYLTVIVLISSVSWAATRVFSVALYRYATDGNVAGPFSESDLHQPFRKRRGLFGRAAADQ
jgi:hypothetical protein